MVYRLAQPLNAVYDANGGATAEALSAAAARMWYLVGVSSGLGGTDGSLYLLGDSGYITAHRALKDAYDRPSKRLQFSRHLTVTFNIPANLRPPLGGISMVIELALPGREATLAPSMPMPEVPINKNDHSCRAEHEVRSPRQPSVKAVSEPSRV